jgi:hypothetical protein
VAIIFSLSASKLFLGNLGVWAIAPSRKKHVGDFGTIKALARFSLNKNEFRIDIFVRECKIINLVGRVDKQSIQYNRNPIN